MLASFAPLGNLRSRITGCARPRGSARTSRLRMQKFVGGVWLQISSRNALQKQRSDESEREPRCVAVPGFFSGLGASKKHRDSMQWRPKATTRRQGPGWRHERHSAERSLERGSDRVPRSVSVRKTRHVRDGSIGRVLTNGSCSGLRKTALFTDGTEEVASVDTRRSPHPVM